jgi:hypothetical protein
MKNNVKLLAFAAVVAVASGAAARQYVDYTPQKGFWEVNAVEVDVNHIDDYLTGLRKSQVPVFEVLKAHGLIDDYKFMVRNGMSKGSPTILIMTHFVNAAALEPDKARDQMIDQEIRARFSEAQDKEAVAGYEKYRSFVDDGLWTEMTMAK